MIIDRDLENVVLTQFSNQDFKEPALSMIPLQVYAVQGVTGARKTGNNEMVTRAYERGELSRTAQTTLKGMEGFITSLGQEMGRSV